MPSMTKLMVNHVSCNEHQGKKSRGTSLESNEINQLSP